MVTLRYGINLPTSNEKIDPPKPLVTDQKKCIHKFVKLDFNYPFGTFFCEKCLKIVKKEI